MKPLPIPNNMKSLRGRQHSQETFHSSHSSALTNGKLYITMTSPAMMAFLLKLNHIILV